MRKSLTLALAFSLITLLSGVGYSQSSVTITLDPPHDQVQKDDLRLPHETLGATRKYSDSHQRPLSSSSPKKKEVTVGRVGVVTASSATIHARPSSRGYAYFSCPKDTYIAIIGENGSWYGVLMSNSSTGWVKKDKVNLLDYQAVTAAPQSQSYSDDFGSRIVNTALQYLGIAYKWGGYSVYGIDCSGFVKAVYASNGIKLPRVARDQAKVGTPLAWGQLMPGDRLYFSCKGKYIDHAGIYMGNNLFIHSSTARKGVAIDNIMTRKFVRSLVAARRG